MGLVWSSRSGELLGYEDTKLDLRSLGDTASKPAVYVNQWMFRGVERFSVPLQYYLSSGPCNSEEIAAQFKDVLMMCTQVGLHVRGVVTDAGSWNSAFFRKIRIAGDRTPANQHWLDDQYVTVNHPLEAGKNIILIIFLRL